LPGFAAADAPVTVLFALAAITASWPDASAAQSVRYRIVPEESEVRYKVRERIARLNFPTDAVGATREITGALILDDAGQVTASSRFEVDLRTLKSNRERRDRYLRQNTLQTAQYPLMVFLPTALDGLAYPLPTSGTHAFRLVGQMTLHGVTKEAIWDTELEFSVDGARGMATTRFTFGDYNLTIPRMIALLSVADDILLELDLVFMLVEGSPDRGGSASE
jgi:polyisoprenoid-binding protein YceI